MFPFINFIMTPAIQESVRQIISEESVRYRYFQLDYAVLSNQQPLPLPEVITLINYCRKALPLYEECPEYLPLIRNTIYTSLLSNTDIILGVGVLEKAIENPFDLEAVKTMHLDTLQCFIKTIVAKAKDYGLHRSIYGNINCLPLSVILLSEIIKAKQASMGYVGLKKFLQKRGIEYDKELKTLLADGVTIHLAL